MNDDEIWTQETGQVGARIVSDMTATLRRGAARTATLAAAAAIALGSIAVAAPASAHDQLVASDPAADATIDALPEQLTLVYSGELIDAEDGTAVQVLSPSGEDVAGEATIDGTDVDVPLTDGGAGDYEVTWRVVSNDGHPVDGSFGFSVSGDAGSDDSDGTDSADSTEERTDAQGEGAADGEAAAEDADASSSPEDAQGGLGAGAWIALGGGLVAVIGGVVAVAVVTSRRNSSGSSGSEQDTGDNRP